MFDKKAETSVPINELIASRWSGRAYDSTRSVTYDQIIALCEAARWAPSCYGDQPWRFIICNRNTDNPAWELAFSCLSEGNQDWAKDAPVLILAVADSIMSRTGKTNKWGQYDTGAAAMNICLQATESGLMVHQMGGFDSDQAKKKFSIPDQYTPMAMMAIGYQRPLEKISGVARERETAGRTRHPIGNNFFDGKWDKAVTGKNL
jgi:nitroreductase